MSGEHRPAEDAPAEPLRVVVVDDELPIRKLLRALLERDPRFEVVDEATNADDAVTTVAAQQPDVVLLDLLMGSSHGRDAIPHLLLEAPRTMVLVLSALSPEDEADEAFAAGAFAYLEKSTMGRALTDDIAELYERFRQALAGVTVWASNDPERIRR